MNGLKGVNYGKLFTKRKDGVYQKFVNGKYIYSKDPEVLYRKWQAILAGPPEKLVKEVAEEWAKKHREEISVRTWNNYEPHFNDIVSKYGDLKISELTAQIVNTDLLSAKAKGYSMTIVKTRKAILNQLLDYATVNDYIKYNSASSVKLPKGLPHSKRSAPTDEEIRAIFENINLEFGFFAFFLLCTGLRKSEALALLKNDIDLENDKISVTKALEYSRNSKPSLKSTKTESGNRVVPIIGILKPELEKYLQNITGDIVFPARKSNRNPGGEYMSKKGYDVAWDNYCKSAEINITAHQLRHGTATLMFEAGVDTYTAKSILGHANITTTMEIYTELRAKQEAKSILKLNEEMKKYKETC